jgi:ABC-type Zn2+ transport system substrate-binding protein/surface adhesin
MDDKHQALKWNVHLWILHRTLLILETSLWKESLNSYCEQFHHYQQNKRKFKQLLWTIPPL